LFACFFVFDFFGGTGAWTQDFTLAKQVLYHLTHISSPFCSGYFRGGSLVNYLLRLVLNLHLLDLSFSGS
jgi:hypothetical protein